ncbi:MAG: T9SS type A sorting domain-containing protein [Candidatus Eisenbacteria bacterium]|nr:T9SS type A sorting domain-containing protein [Candidatus Eisenbacteria bacterium]
MIRDLAMWRGITVISVGLSCLHWSEAAEAARLAKDVVGASGAVVVGSGFRLGFTAGEPAVGPSAGTGWSEIAGFWGRVLLVTSASPDSPAIPEMTALGRPFPNPSVGTSRFPLALAATEANRPTRLTVHDASGREVLVLHQGVLSPGVHNFDWSGRDGSGRAVASGCYFVRLTTEQIQLTRKVTIAR